MRNDQEVLHSPFDIETHKETFINYLEVIITEDGTILYAVPSHQEKLIALACEKLSVSRESLTEMIPQNMYGDVMTWLIRLTNSVSLWNKFMLGEPNEQQHLAIRMLSDEGLYEGDLVPEAGVLIKSTAVFEYTRTQMLNQLMWAETEYYRDNLQEHPTTTEENWLQERFDLYKAMTTDSLREFHRERVDCYYESEEDVLSLLQKDEEDLLEGRNKLWFNS